MRWEGSGSGAGDFSPFSLSADSNSDSLHLFLDFPTTK